MELHVEFPEKSLRVLEPPARYKILHGGRGSAKSWSIARRLVLRAAFTKLRILCTREIQASIKDSVHRLLTDQIKSLGLGEYFVAQENTIKSTSGSEFIFKGLRNNTDEVKSTEGVDICWVEEAEAVSEASWRVLIPTIRKDGSEIWISFNPKDENSATYTRYVKGLPDNALREEMNYEDNPWFPDVLRQEMEYDKRTDYEKYLHVWRGKPEKYGEALIFRGKFRVEEFETPKDVEFYFGLDFGFSVDPLAFNRYFIIGKTLYIDQEVYGLGIELDDIPKRLDEIPGARKWRITADSARPDTISYLRKKGFQIYGAEKGEGSVEDGITFLRSFEAIIIHPRCRGAKDNFENYKWKVDKNTGMILPVPVDASNHVPDNARYALEKLIKSKKTIWEVL